MPHIIKDILMEIDLQHHFTSTIFNEYSHLAKLGFILSQQKESKNRNIVALFNLIIRPISRTFEAYTNNAMLSMDSFSGGQNEKIDTHK